MCGRRCPGLDARSTRCGTRHVARHPLRRSHQVRNAGVPGTKAEIIAVGTEILLGQILNTNARYLSEQMALLGIDMYFQTVVGDNESRMVNAFLQARARSDIVMVTGGLGPTMDDLTKDVLARALGREMRFDEGIWRGIEQYFVRTGRQPTENNKRQAYIISGADVLDNPFGTAPGILLEDSGTLFCLLPGPQREMVPMFEAKVRPYLLAKGYGGVDVIHSKLVRICGIGESSVEDMVKDLMATSTNPTIAPYASLGEVHLRVTSKAGTKDLAGALVDGMVEKLRERLSDNVFGYDSVTLPEAVGGRLSQLGWTLALAESCTGGLAGERVTSVPGSSGYFLGGVIAYSNKAKQELLGVSLETLTAFGAVSRETALEMALGAKKAFGSDVAISVTGVAGPGGGSPAKPVGTVHIGLVTPLLRSVTSHLFRPPRADVQWRSSQQALTDLWLHLGRALKEQSGWGERRSGRESPGIPPGDEQSR